MTKGAHDKIFEIEVDFWPEIDFLISISEIEMLKILAFDFFFKFIYGIKICSKNRIIKLRYQTDFCSKLVSGNRETEK